MANYIGNQPLNGEFKRLDSIESQFNNSSTSFGLKYNNVSQTVGDASQLIVSLNGVIQEPLTSYTLSGVTNIVFASPPANGDTCFIILLGGIGGTVTPSDNSVTTAKLTNNSVTSAKIVNNTITADDMDSSDNYAFNNITVATNTLVTDATNDRIGVGTANPTYPLDVEDASAGFIKGSFVSTGSSHSSITFDNTGSDAASVRVGSNNNDFYVRTSGSEKMRVTSGGYVGIGDNDPEKILHVSYASASTGVNKTASALTDPVVVIENLNDASGNYSGIQFSGSGSSSTDTVASSAIYGFHESRGGTYPYGYMAFYTTNSGGSHTERMRIDNSGNVGIGSNSPTEKLVVNGAIGSSNQSLGFSSGPHRVAMDIINASKIARIGTITGTATPTGDEGTVTFLGNDSEKMRIDTSGNLLVGMTSASTSNDGVGLRANGLIHGKRADVVATFNRKTTAGTVVEIASDNTVVGRMLTGAGGYMHITGGNLTFGSGVAFNNQTWNPTNASGTITDNHVKLGDTGSRFTDLYLSGGVYVGGTGSANYLDDYEEGTWTPSLGTTGTQPSVTYSGITRGGKYVKVGRLVTVNFSMRINAHSGGTGEYLITGLPFTTSTAVGDHAGVSVGGLEYHPITSTSMPIQVINNNSNHVRMLIAQNNTGWASYTPPSQFAIYMSFSYETNS